MEPLTLGPFAVARDGLLQPLDPTAPPALHFAWRGRPCAARVTGSAVELASCAARIPSSAEPGADREHAFATLAALPPQLPVGWKVKLLPDHQIRLEAATTLQSPPTATSLIAALVRFALALDPYLDQLEDAGVRYPPAAGTVNTWPG